ncbi:hypothetical protein, partial [Sebaldella sp. S0638]|uniref:hypothetical protein n=1 Tax=Sebaldella sp. S0638 TaxID=2957809 RepID=UPI00209D473E
LAIYQDIAEIAPEIVGVISNEASEYKKLGDYLGGVVEGLKQKILLQMQEDMWKKASAEAKKYIDEIYKADIEIGKLTAEMNKLLAKEYKLKISVDQIVTDDLMSKYKKYWENGLNSDDLSDINGTLDKIAVAQGLSGEQAESFKIALDEYARSKMSEEEKGLEAFQKAQDFFIKSDSEIQQKINLTNSILGTFNNEFGQIKSKTEISSYQMINELNRQSSELQKSTAITRGALTGEIRDAKGNIIATVNTGKDSITGTMIAKHAETQGEIHIVGSNVTTMIKDMGNGLFRVVERSLANNQVLSDKTITREGLEAQGDLAAKGVEDAIKNVSKTIGNEKIKGYAGPSSTKNKKG